MLVSSLTVNGSAVRSTRRPGFDYSDLSSSVATFLKGQAERIRRQASLSVINIGKDLIFAKRYLSHGAFIAWVEGEIGIPARTAQAYMRVAKWAPPKNSQIQHLPISLLYLLAASSTPEAFAEDILKRIAAGERISIQTIRDELRDLREARQDECQHQRCRMLPGPEHDTRCSEIEPGLIVPPTRAQNSTPLQEAVAILAHRLPARDFVRIQDILTDGAIISDPEFPQRIADAFLTFAKQDCPELHTCAPD